MCNVVVILLTKFVYFDSECNENSSACGYTIDDDFESCFDDRYESLSDAADALSPKNILTTLLKRFPRFVDVIEHEGSATINGICIDVENLSPVDDK
jgi:hypothetical protein